MNEALSPAEADRLTDALADLAAQAAAAIRARPPHDHRLKHDRSPVTDADEAAEAIILGGLRTVLPGVAVIAEEAVARGERSAPASTFVLVDPLDGTKEFLAGNGEYTVNIALVKDGRPVLGVIAAPALGLIWRGAGAKAERAKLTELGAWTSIRTRAWPPAPCALVSRSHLDPDTEAFVKRFPACVLRSVGSSLKFCRLAEGEADIYPRFGPTSEWDIAAGHAILAAAGGAVTTTDGGELRYGGADLRIPAFIAWGDRAKIKV